MDLQVKDRPLELDAQLPIGAMAPSSARALVTGLRGRVAGDVLDDLVLVVSEVVTNCIRHARLGPHETIRLRLTATATGIRLEVIDTGRGFVMPVIAAHDPALPGGWGLYIVDQLADRWGVMGERGTHLWFEIDTNRDGRRAARSA
jgi:anti-sigma regulatory factor (Ser/Thr protein kinase)